MVAPQTDITPSQTIAELVNVIERAEEGEGAENLKSASELFLSLEPEDMALSLEALPFEHRVPVWSQVPPEEKLDVLIAMRGEARLLLLKQLPEEDLPGLFEEIEAEDLIGLADTLPDKIIDMALGRMDAQQKKYYDMAQQYEETAAGRWLNHDILVVSQNTRVAEALRVLRREAPDYTEVIYLVDRIGRWTGCTLVTKLLAAQPHQNVAALREEEYVALVAEADVYDAAEQVERSGYSALPVINAEGVLLGRLDVGTAMELIRENLESQMMANAGLAEGADLFAPVKRSAQTRAVWLGINLLTAFLASWFIGLFEATIQEVVALAVLMPVVASMGGIAGSQTLTLIVRGLALKQISAVNFKQLLNKEFRVGLLNGVLWALVIGLIANIWFDSILLGIVIAAAIVVNICCAAISGVVIPVLLDKLKLDPALAGSVILTTVTDVVGFVAFLGLGALLLV